MRLTAPGYLWVALVTLLAVVLTIVLAVNVARNRSRHGVEPPRLSGPPDFESALRIHANTVEFLAPFVASLWLFAIYLQPLAAAVLGFVWLFGRVVYAIGYAAAPGKRLPGFAISMTALVLLVLGAFFGVIRAFLAQP